MSLRVVVVGGSLGGLTAANLLRDAGADVTVLERSEVPLTGRGAGIVQHPMTVRYLVERAGLDLDALSTAARFRRYVDAQDRVVVEHDRGYRFTGYATLHAGLRDAFGDGDHRLGQTVSAVHDLHTDAPSVTTDAGARVEADLLILADGVGGVGRSLLFGDRVVRTPAGYVAWRGFAREEDLPSEARSVLGDAIVFHLMPEERSHILTYPIPDVEDPAGTRLINFVWYRNVAGAALEDLLTAADGSHRATSVPPGMLAARHDTSLRAHAAAVLPPSMRSLVDRTAEPFVQVVSDVEVPAMVSGRACVIGDGAWSVRPHTAAATAKACADAWTLMDALNAAGAVADAGAVPAALAAWEPGQMALGRQLLLRARSLGEGAQVTGSWDPDDPGLEFGLFRAGDTLASS